MNGKPGRSGDGASPGEGRPKRGSARPAGKGRNEPRSRDSGLDGLLVIDKPAGWTSHDVVAKLRGITRQRRAGHAGTLDPDATGVLLVGFGQCTRLLPYLTALRKRYTADVVLGVETSTLDAAGDVTARHSMGVVSVDEAHAAAQRFVGEILQIPPMVSAVQIGGRRLHELARQGIEIERAPRPVTVYRFDVVAEPRPAVLSIEVECGSGTYVRVLAADLGRTLGGGAHLTNLRRTAIGPFDSDGALALDSVTPETRLLPPLAAMAGHPLLLVDDALADRVARGGVLRRAELGAEGEGPWAISRRNGALVAVGQPYGRDEVKPAVVLDAR